MIGYHYTSEKNCNKIMKRGLSPYKMVRPEFLPWFANGEVFGIWLWETRPSKLARAGNVLFQVASKGDPVVCELAVEYKYEDILKVEGDSVTTIHDGVMENFVYHKNEPAIIITNKVPPKDIVLIRRYDVVELLNAQETEQDYI